MASWISLNIFGNSENSTQNDKNIDPEGNFLI